LRKLRSWRPRLAEKPEEITVTRFGSVADWARSMRAEGFSIVGTAIEGGALPWSTPGSSPGPPLAILFGEETKGLSKDALLHCDRLWTLPLGQGGRFYTLGQATAAILGGMKK
jgi:tRNA G18 (ribose-2'-O)-methylase SpoU